MGATFQRISGHQTMSRCTTHQRTTGYVGTKMTSPSMMYALHRASKGAGDDTVVEPAMSGIVSGLRSAALSPTYRSRSQAYPDAVARSAGSASRSRTHGDRSVGSGRTRLR